MICDCCEKNEALIRVTEEYYCPTCGGDGEDVKAAFSVNGFRIGQMDSVLDYEHLCPKCAIELYWDMADQDFRDNLNQLDNGNIPGPREHGVDMFAESAQK